METKTITLSVKEGKRYELHLFHMPTTREEHSTILSMVMGFKIHNRHLLSGSVEDLLQLSNKEEIAERVCDNQICGTSGCKVYKDYDNKNDCKIYPLESLLSAIGDYKYIIITSTEI